MKFNVPQPCHEDWNKMLPEQKGAFCNACNKIVVDFTKMSDEEMIQYFESKKEERICGRFKSTQLDTPVTHTFHLSKARVRNGLKGMFLLSLFAAFTAMFSLTSCTNQVMGDPVVINDLVDTIYFAPGDTAKASIDTVVIDTATLIDVPEITMGIIRRIEPCEVKPVEPEIAPEPQQEPERYIMGKMIPPDRRPKK